MIVGGGGGRCMVAEWGVCDCGGCVVAGGACVVVRGVHGEGGMHGKRGGICGEGGMHGKGGHAWDMTRYGQLAGGTHPTGMHSCLQVWLARKGLFTRCDSDCDLFTTTK